MPEFDIMFFDAEEELIDTTTIEVATLLTALATACEYLGNRLTTLSKVTGVHIIQVEEDSDESDDE